MKITGITLGLVLLAATACVAETPEPAGFRPSAGPLFPRGRMFSGENWWTRFGDPINAEAISAANAQVAPVGVGGGMYNGYIYAPGSCDCPPPCIDQLWTGYWQHPKRCNPYVPLCQKLGGGCGNGCGNCGDGNCNGGCNNCGGCGLFGKGKGCGCGCSDGLSCSTKAACGCSAPISCTSAPDCSAKPLCGCKHAHLGHKWKNFKAHWSCDSCSAPIGCGCATPVAPAIEFPSEKQALSRPQPLPEEATLIALPRLN